MIEFLEFTFESFTHFIGVIILIVISSMGLSAVLGSFRLFETRNNISIDDSKKQSSRMSISDIIDIWKAKKNKGNDSEDKT